MEDKKISIIVPVYNARKTLNQCVESLVKQYYSNVEIILVDDGSIDGSASLCDRWPEKDKRIVAYHTENRGVSMARNWALKKASGEYITFVDADDYILQDMLVVLVKELEETGVDIVGCEYLPWSDQEAPVFQQMDALQAYNREIFTKEHNKGFIEAILTKGDTRIWSKLFRRNAMGELRFDEKISIGEDMLFLLELIKKGASISRISYQGYCYYVNQQGAMMSEFKPSYMDQITCWKKARLLLVGQDDVFLQKLTVIQIMSIMLVVGKLAVVEGNKSHKQYVRRCREELKACFHEKGAFSGLSGGYQVKAILFYSCPELYLSMYGKWKK